MGTDVKMPSLGMTMEEGRVVAWRVRQGEVVVRGQILLDIESEKTAYEMESPADGRVGAILVPDDTTVAVGTTLCSILADDEAAQVVAGSPARADAQPSGNPAARRRMSPRARRLADTMGVDVAALAGSGADGMILEEDVRAAARVAAAPTAPAPAQAGVTLQGEPGFVLRPFTSIRRITAERMADSARSAPHIFLAIEADGSALLRYRAEHGERLAAETGTKPTLTDLLVVIAARTLTRHRALNASYTVEGIREWSTVDLGIAVAVDDGLVVPVIRGAGGKPLAQVMRDRVELVARARAGRLTPADMENGTFTLSNLGPFGIDFFTSILNPPQAAILSVGALVERVVAVAGQAVVRPTMFVGLTIDHRVADGAAGARFLADFRLRVENGDIDG